jgi:zinc protease
MKTPLLITGLMLLSATMLSAQNSETFSKVQELGGIEEYKLDKNGLSVLLMEDHSAPVVTVMVTYNVGSRNEVTGTTGATHLLEHLMFKGTDKYNRADGTGMDAMLQNRGALLNATTWLDRTN